MENSAQNLMKWGAYMEIFIENAVCTEIIPGPPQYSCQCVKLMVKAMTRQCVKV